MESSFPSIFQTRNALSCKDYRVDKIELLIESDGHCNYLEHIGELQEKLKSYQSDLKKKDEMIQKLSTLEIGNTPKCNVKSNFPSTSESGLCNYRSEIAALQVKVDLSNKKMQDKEVECKSKDEQIKVFQHELNLCKEEIIKERKLNENLKNQVSGFEGNMVLVDKLKHRNNFVVSSFQAQYQVIMERNAELEARILSLLSERENVEQICIKSDKSRIDFIEQVSHILSLTKVTDVNILISKIADIVQENGISRGRIFTLTEQIKDCEKEMKSSREALTLLAAQVSNGWRDTSGTGKTYDELKKACEANAVTIKDQAKQIELLEIQVTASKNALNASKKEINERDALVAKLECEKREKQHNVESQEQRFSNFLNSVAMLLSSAYCHIPTTEEAVQEKIKTLLNEVKEQQQAISALETRLNSLTRKFEVQCVNLHESVDKVKHSAGDESHIMKLKERISFLEGELATGDALRNSLRVDKEKCYKFVQKLGKKLNTNHLKESHGFEVIAKEILGRVDQLVYHEKNFETKDFDNVLHNLQRKCHSLKEQLESKDLHLDLLRQKIRQHEELFSSPSHANSDQRKKNLKLRHKLEHWRRVSQELRADVDHLKGQLQACSDSKALTSELLQHDEIDDCLSEVDQRRGCDCKNVRLTLDECRRNEHTLIKFRQKVAGIVGLRVDRISNHEVINRLQRLVAATKLKRSSSLNAHDVSFGSEDALLEACDNSTQRLNLQPSIAAHQTNSSSTRHDPCGNAFASANCDNRKY